MRYRIFVIFQIILLSSLLFACSGSPAPSPSTQPSREVAPDSDPTIVVTKSSYSTEIVKPEEAISPTEPLPTALPTFTSLASPAPLEDDALVPTPLSSVSPETTQFLASVLQQAHCRYGPGTAFLHAHDLYEGDRGIAEGRNASGSWLWIQPSGLDRHCWVAASVVQMSGEIKTLPVVESKLPYSNLYGPPQNVQAYRDGSTVTITWDLLPFTVDDDRGYMLQLTTCQAGGLVSENAHITTNSYTIQDESGCAGASGGTLWGVEKHGYTQAVEIPWP
jgi:hypothetical protein